MWDDARALNAMAAAIATIAVLFAGAAGLGWVVRQPVFAFRDVVIRGSPQRASTAHLEAVVRGELTGTFFTMSLEKSRAAIAAVPWVRTVALRRQWPRRLEVTIAEHVPLARWNEAALVNVEGEVFVADYDGELPQFTGPDGQAREMAERYREWAMALLPLGLTVSELRLSPRRAWQVVASGEFGPLAIEMGREEPGARLARFVGAYARTIAVLRGAGTRIEHVDLRYRNGFAARIPGFREKPPKRKA
jgi:cell division protein FtsQ